MTIFDKYDLIDVDETFPIPDLPSSGLILLVGASGSGKSTILKSWFDGAEVEISNERIIDQFSTPSRGESFLISAGLRTIPAWKRPPDQLSNGERHRFELALVLDRGVQCFDEFTSVVDRETAKSLAFSIQRYFKEAKISRFVLASCHRDVVEWLDPDYVYDTDRRKWKDSQLFPRGRLRRPKIKIKLQSVKGADFWPIFKKYHYLNSKMNQSAQSFVGFFQKKPVVFVSVLRFPNGNFKNGWREHRTVVLPEFQGLGIGTKCSEAIGNLILENGGRFFSKTSHPSFVHSRNKSKKWKPTSKNGKTRFDYLRTKTKTKEDGHKRKHFRRLCGSHEYVGEQPSLEDAKA